MVFKGLPHIYNSRKHIIQIWKKSEPYLGIYTYI